MKLPHTGRALADAAPVPYWLDRPERPDPLPPLAGTHDTDLLVIGGGYSGLWTALLAKEADPGRDVLLVEAGTCGWAASGRNGGFCAASLTHGLANGVDRFPGEIDELERLGRENLDAIAATVGKHGIECDFERTGELAVAVEPYQLAGLTEAAELARRYGHDVRLLDRDEVRAEVDSPTYLGGMWDRDRVAMLDPARLAWGLRRAALDLGVRIHEHTRVTGLRPDGGALRAATAGPDGAPGTVLAGQVVLATNAFPPLLRRLRAWLVPVYDYALMTEPLTPAQRDAIGWRNRQGLADTGNQFHYYRITTDGRILFGGYDAVYHYGNRMAPSLEQRAATFTALASHFFTIFPQLADLRFSHRWGGVIDTCTRFCPFFGTAYDGRLAYAAGFTGLGVGATRFGARVMLDLLGGAQTPLTRLDLVRSKPLPFPPEPFRATGINLTRWSLARADAREGRRNLWLRTLDRLGLGFDS
ncbi:MULTISPECIES: FAD-binding oxidoreductase [Micromonospora]|uniref:FAD-dependent oxidoreductase n=1 Tax=Micromonospora solifontis TaxID=2487138 RepID=A0ABX9WIE5_9ACTN|nr:MULTISPECIES: FAD-dependent oxidoreductase [Micromonospora]NES15246.1 FAD-dependent oxidoreductase [Micromonospora sp. PPF5-17B]NES36518.1 FAD-dependent oxidoreductase [Micromonospora solifontis]NES56338.1 FAD-dependent oxidoreductase [Micromonospora sp. PPF5-6]RNL99408.1 FAD-dependent oxidoreductase [Micromonospora solifontis]